MRFAPVLACMVALAALYLSASPAVSKGFSLERHQDRVEVTLDGQPFTAFHFESKWDKPFLYPLRTPSGVVVSRGWPVAPREGEQQDHAWHRGIWYGHGDINGEDFWREKPDKTTSRLVVSGNLKISSGNTLEVPLAMMTPKAKKMGSIVERYIFSLDGPHLVIDANIAVSADQGEALRFGDSDDGGFGFRLADEFREDRGAELMNSDGLTGTAKIWGKPARWVKYEAAVGGKASGVLMLDHPSNLRHPTRWHARGYSLCSANPFALGSFTKDKKADGSYTIPAGNTMQLRYRVVIYDGKTDRADADRLFAGFAKN